ncbi:NADP-dependent 3-hydroxy acid dehydrogenase YdfG [Panacagrimonas perspica]|uniref:NADP-dependent 3-hydroxy acid dehydrogenase YdfG n=1 Tax=Panacagrimonas perspica TaxID=381431 RepID=A0A4R7NZH3_9GAMM|nr:SDR family oxidoreductase [Panacagrimonas perspica]TDU26548.1 NADP-dependent 3-hydroxy acid dehydrogenase YdfG [Panacagrimonas perspica]THD03917.1 short chain dehydrogenase [Panacagrimonas perspica]
MRTLKDSRVLITGAGSGLGRACALAFAAQGARVAVTDMRADAAQETAKLLEAGGASALSLVLDVTSEESFAAAVTAVTAAWGGVDVLINNAGVATAGTVEESPIKQWDWVFNINVLGCVRGARAVIPTMKAQAGGHIVNVASFAGIANPPAMASYNAAKAAVISLSETLRYEVFPDIGVSVACPSFFKTDLVNTSKVGLASGEKQTAPQMMRIVERMMEKASVTAEDVAGEIVDAVASNRFLVMPHADARSLWRLKRLSPELYFRKAQKATASFLTKR